MRDVLTRKLALEPGLANFLRSTADRALVELTTPWQDVYWGMVQAYEREPGVYARAHVGRDLERSVLVGENHLGRLWMELRSQLA